MVVVMMMVSMMLVMMLMVVLVMMFVCHNLCFLFEFCCKGKQYFLQLGCNRSESAAFCNPVAKESCLHDTADGQIDQHGQPQAMIAHRPH